MKNLYYLLLPFLLCVISCQKEEIKSTYSISGVAGYAPLPGDSWPGIEYPEFKVNLLENNEIIATHVGHEYSFTNLEEGKNYTVVPFVSEALSNGGGITAIDFIELRKFIEGVIQLNPFQQLAADIDKNNIINQTDLELLETCLLAGECYSFRFVSPDYTGPGTSYLDQYTVDNLSSDHVADFRPIKIGDVNSY